MFKEHQVTSHHFVEVKDLDIGYIRWQKPGSSLDLVDFVIHNGVKLYVTGSFGEAVYAWPDPVTLRQMFECGLEGFHLRCVASQTGSQPYDWDSKKALDVVERHVQVIHIADEAAWPEHLRGEKAQKRVRAFWHKRLKDSNVRSATYTRQEWLRWLEAPCSLTDLTEAEELSCNGAIFFGRDWAHSALDDGEVIAYSCEMHHTALGKALTWLREEL